MNTPDTHAHRAVRRRKPSAARLKALRIVAAGRAEYGSEFPELDRRAAARGRSVRTATFLIDGAGIYGAEHATWQAVEEFAWIAVRHDLVPTHAVAPRVAEYTSVSGTKHTRVLPAHREPVDPGWRAVVDLTDAGRAVLEAAPAGPPADGR